MQYNDMPWDSNTSTDESGSSYSGGYPPAPYSFYNFNGTNDYIDSDSFQSTSLYNVLSSPSDFADVSNSIGAVFGVERTGERDGSNHVMSFWAQPTYGAHYDVDSVDHGSTTAGPADGLSDFHHDSSVATVHTQTPDPWSALALAAHPGKWPINPSPSTVPRGDQSAEKPFACEACPLRFRDDGDLQRHRGTAHKRGAHIYVCTSCGYAMVGRNDKVKKHCKTFDRDGPVTYSMQSVEGRMAYARMEAQPELQPTKECGTRKSGVKSRRT